MLRLYLPGDECHNHDQVAEGEYEPDDHKDLVNHKPATKLTRLKMVKSLVSKVTIVWIFKAVLSFLLFIIGHSLQWSLFNRKQENI